MTEQHITVNGTPWCRCCMQGSNSAVFAALLDSETPIFCAGNMPSDEAAVELLKSKGLDAVLVDRPCPELEA